MILLSYLYRPYRLRSVPVLCLCHLRLFCIFFRLFLLFQTFLSDTFVPSVLSVLPFLYICSAWSICPICSIRSTLVRSILSIRYRRSIRFRLSYHGAYLINNERPSTCMTSRSFLFRRSSDVTLNTHSPRKYKYKYKYVKCVDPSPRCLVELPNNCSVTSSHWVELFRVTPIVVPSVEWFAVVLAATTVEQDGATWLGSGYGRFSVSTAQKFLFLSSLAFVQCL